MDHKLVFTHEADSQRKALENNPATRAVFTQVNKALGYLEKNPRHPSLHTHEYTSLVGVNGEKVFEAYAQNDTPGAYRIFWHYGPHPIVNKKRIPTITIVAITDHP